MAKRRGVNDSSQRDGVQQYVKLEQRLVLLAWLNSLFGYKTNRELLEDVKGVAEGYGADGHSYVCYHLLARGDAVKIPRTDLERYDENIRRYLQSINRCRTEPITLRYFQYLAALYAEVFLDRLFDSPRRLVSELNEFVKARNANKQYGESPDETFSESDLAKLAFWMATGSGKTLIMHINYFQFLHYNREPIDNILLITPNEGLTEQHLRELELSGIPARKFEASQHGALHDRNEVQVIDIHKLVEEKRGGGVTVPVEAFEGRNLIFVDEGHKGTGGEKWRSYRDELGKTGFTFEYSATFGQALTAARNDPLTSEYGKSIVFDYSYRYFYGDGFGKDFRILNLKEERAELTETLLVGNLLSFYEQLCLFADKEELLKPYNLDKPLWVFVGSTVNAVYSERGEKRSDVLTVVRFIHHFLQDRDWATETLSRVLAGNTGLKTPDDRDIFEGRFEYLHNKSLGSDELYDDILSRVFHSPGPGGLHVCTIKNCQGELGLKAGDTQDYFGVIYVGDDPAFRKLVEEDPSGISVGEDAISHSLFENINKPESTLHVLIGAKKFMEGWNSWRVSSMGLLNIGRQEGSQIIQLFGRGVRLRGKYMCLKRSSAFPDDNHPPHIGLLETLNIFAIRANYMAEFRKYLEREGIETAREIQVRVPVKLNRYALAKDLLIPRIPNDRDFAGETVVLLKPDKNVSVELDLLPRAEVVEGRGGELHSSKASAAMAKRIPSGNGIPVESLELVDWESVYLGLLDFKQRKGLKNLVIRPGTLREILRNGSCRLLVEENVVHPRTCEERELLTQAVTSLLCLYAESFHRTRREEWEQSIMQYAVVDEGDPNLSFNFEYEKPHYVVRIRSSDLQLLQKIEELLSDLNKLHCTENKVLRRINFDCHLYMPLLLEEDVEGITTSPPRLTKSEKDFVDDVRAYWRDERDNALRGKEVFLLRNLGRGRGVGFFEGRGFYPDFILWVLDDDSQRVVFVEPHGMLHAKAYAHDEKARLHESLKKLAEELRSRYKGKNVSLDSYIISATPFEELQPRYGDGNWTREDFKRHHILFPDKEQRSHIGTILLGESVS
jgi:hypothetical protein